MGQNKLPLMNSNVLLPQLLSSSSQIRQSISILKLMPQHMQLVLYYHNSAMMEGGDLLALPQRAFQMQNATMISMTKSYSLSSVVQKNGITSWREPSTKLRS